MSYMANKLGADGYDVIQMPKNIDDIEKSFSDLPQDPYYEGRLR